MNNKKTTKRALLSSVMAIVLCLAMLIGTTFAWFTDSASTAVNKIQAGNLDVALEMKNADGTWVNAEGKTLGWVAADDRAQDKILWEPDCRYELPALRVVNKGNLALKYKVIISAASGDMALANVLDVMLNGQSTGNTLADALFTTDPDGFAHGEISANSDSGELKIALHMMESAGNEYQGLSIDGIGITVVATQDTVENDSIGSNYDVGAEFNKKSATIMDDINGKTITLEKGKTYTVGNGQIVVAANGDLTYTNTGAAQTVTITTDGGTLTVDAPNDTVIHYGEANFVNIIKEFTFSNVADEKAFCADCYNHPGTDHAGHQKYLNIVNGVAEVKQTGAWMNFADLDWAKKAYVLEYDIDLSDLDEGAFVAFYSGETISWQDLQLGFKKDANGITAYNTLFTNSLNNTNNLGLIGNKVHAVYTYSVNASNTLEMKLVISDGANTYTVAKTVNDFDTSASLCWDVYTTDGENEIYAKLDNFVFKSIEK